MSALAVAQQVARATGNQIKVMEMLWDSNATIGNLISETGRAEFARRPDHAVRAEPDAGHRQDQGDVRPDLQNAMDAMDTFRAKAIDVMGQNNTIIRQQLERADTYVDRTRQQQAREAAGQAAAQMRDRWAGEAVGRSWPSRAPAGQQAGVGPIARLSTPSAIRLATTGVSDGAHRSLVASAVE